MSDGSSEPEDMLVGTRDERFLLSEIGEPGLSLRHRRGPGASLLYVHGATFPAALSIHYRIDGQSWADDLSARGFDLWSFDFPGYGGSERPDGMHPAARGPDALPGRAAGAARQIGRIVRHITQRTQRPRVSIIAHSWGTIPAGLFAGRHPALVDRLVLFGPIGQRNTTVRDLPSSPVQLVGVADQWESFRAGPPEGETLISRDRFEQWAEAYLATDPDSATRMPPSVAVPSGPEADLAESWSGSYPHDPLLIRCPTLIVRGEWDSVSPDEDVAWLIAAMAQVPGGAVDVKLPRGAHRMHLEENRQALFDAVASFLKEDQR